MLARAGLHLGTTTVGRMLKGGEDAAELTPAPAPIPSPMPARTPVPSPSSEMTAEAGPTPPGKPAW